MAKKPDINDPNHIVWKSAPVAYPALCGIAMLVLALMPMGPTPNVVFFGFMLVGALVFFGLAALFAYAISKEDVPPPP